MPIDYSKLPYHMQRPARDYVELHVPPGDFLTAVLCNDLVGAFAKADSKNFLLLHVWASWVYNECPSNAWGSPAKVKAWVAKS